MHKSGIARLKATDSFIRGLSAELLRKVLTKVLGIPEDTAEEEACLMEHAISDESFKKWNSYIKQLDL